MKVFFYVSDFSEFLSVNKPDFEKKCKVQVVKLHALFLVHSEDYLEGWLRKGKNWTAELRTSDCRLTKVLYQQNNKRLKYLWKDRDVVL